MRALVVSGGGSKGAFAVGVLSRLMREGEMKYDIVGGTSTGALIAPMAFLGKISLLKQIYTSVNTEDILRERDSLKQIYSKGSFLDPVGLENMVNQKVTNEVFQKIKDSGKLVYFSAVCLNTGDVFYFSTKDMSTDGDFKFYKLFRREEMIKAIMASSNQPVLMPPIRILDKLYVDGGIRENVPIRGALFNGATEVDIIMISPKQIKYNFTSSDVLSILKQTIDIITDDVVYADVELAKAVAKEKGIKLNFYRPAAKLPIKDDLEFNPKEMMACLNLGITAADNPEIFNFA